MFDKEEGVLMIIEKGNDNGYFVFGVKEAISKKKGNWFLGVGFLGSATFEIEN